MTPTNAYVLVQTTMETDHLARVLRTVPGVLFAEDVRGPYDSIALAGSDGGVDGLQTILDEIRALPGVIRAVAAPRAGAVVEVPSVDAA